MDFGENVLNGRVHSVQKSVNAVHPSPRPTTPLVSTTGRWVVCLASGCLTCCCSVGCRLVGYDTFLYSSSSSPSARSAGKIGLSCSSPDYSTIDECDVVTATEQPTHKCLFSGALSQRRQSGLKT